MALDNTKNFAKVTVSTGYDASATSIVLSSGHGAKLPTAPFNLTWWNSTDYADPSDDPNVEIVRCTNVATDTLTVTRAQESTSASTKNTAAKTYKMIAGLTSKVINSDLTGLFLQNPATSAQDMGGFKITDAADPVSASDMATKNYVDLVAAGLASGPNKLVSGGGVASTTGLTLTVQPATYVIAGVQYSSPQSTVTLGTADASHERYDIIAVDNTGTVVVIAGTPASTPVLPAVDPSTQLQLTFIDVPATATTPGGLVEEDIYLENTEWTSAVTSNFNAASTNNPYAGTKDIEATTAAAGNNVTLTRPSGTINLLDYDFFTVRIRSKASWANQKSLSIGWFNGATPVGIGFGIAQGIYGFDSTVTSGYQQVSIPTSVFQSAGNAVNKVRLQVAGSGSAIGFYLDNIMLQKLAPPAAVVSLGRTSKSFTTGSLANNASTNGSIVMSKSQIVYKVVASQQCRVRLYSTAAGQSGDASRSVGVKAAWNSKLLLELVLNSASLLSFDMQPPALCENEDTTTASTLYWHLTNLSGSTNPVTVTFTSLVLE